VRSVVHETGTGKRRTGAQVERELAGIGSACGTCRANDCTGPAASQAGGGACKVRPLISVAGGFVRRLGRSPQRNWHALGGMPCCLPCRLRCATQKYTSLLKEAQTFSLFPAAPAERACYFRASKIFKIQHIQTCGPIKVSRLEPCKSPAGVQIKGLRGSGDFLQVSSEVGRNDGHRRTMERPGTEGQEFLGRADGRRSAESRSAGSGGR